MRHFFTWTKPNRPPYYFAITSALNFTFFFLINLRNRTPGSAPQCLTTRGMVDFTSFWLLSFDCDGSVPLCPLSNSQKSGISLVIRTRFFGSQKFHRPPKILNNAAASQAQWLINSLQLAQNWPQATHHLFSQDFNNQTLNPFSLAIISISHVTRTARAAAAACVSPLWQPPVAPSRLPCSTASTQAAERHGFGAGECLQVLKLGACAFVWLRWWQGIGLEECRMIRSLKESSLSEAAARRAPASTTYACMRRRQWQADLP